MRSNHDRPSAVVTVACVLVLVAVSVTTAAATTGVQHASHADGARDQTATVSQTEPTGTPTTGPSPTPPSNGTATPVETSFVVSNLTAPTLVRVGDGVTVTATVTNRAGVRGTETLRYSFDGATVVRSNVTLDPGASKRVSVAVSAEELETVHGPIDAGTYVHGVRNESGAGVAARLRVTPDVDFTVERIEAPTEVSYGEPYVVLATVRNPGDTTITRRVSYTFAGQRIDEKAVTVAGNDTRQVAFQISLADVETAVGPVENETTYDHAIVSGGDHAGGAVRVVDGPRADASSLAVESFETIDDVRPGDFYQVTLAVRNVDTADFEGQLAYRVDGSVVETEWVRVPIGERRTVEFRVSYDDVDRSAVPLSSQRTTHGVWVGDDSVVTRPVTVHATTETRTATPPAPTFTATSTTPASTPPAATPTSPTPAGSATADGGQTCRRGFFSACGGTPLGETSLTLVGVFLSGFGIVYEMYRGRR
jgi:hypothetical protein